MIQIKQITEKHEYDKLWHELGGHLLQSWQWGEIKYPRWRPMRLAFYKKGGSNNGSEGVAVAVLTILVKDFSRIGLMFGYVPRGDIPTENFEEIWEALEKFIREKGLIDLVLFELNTPTTQANDFITALPRFNYRVQPGCSNVVDLSVGEEKLWMGMKGKYRRNVKKSVRDGVSVTVYEEGDEALEKFYGVMKDLTGHKGFVIQSREYFEKVWKILSVQQCARIYIAELDLEPDRMVVGAYFIACDDKTAFELYGGVTKEGRSTEAGYALKWEAIKSSAKGGKLYYDHWGVAPKKGDDYDLSHELGRISQFKAGFGGEDVCYTETKIMKINSLKARIFSLLHYLQRLNIWVRK
ncbi:MAG: lipid II:glycine glycyltransferase FemX [Candidatus Dojkabacteria bacterium]